MKSFEKNKKGISLLILVITIIVVIIIATAVILVLTGNNPMDSAKKARFMSNFTNVEEGVGIYSASKLTADNIEYILPLGENVSLAEKESIKANIPTLQSKVEELSGKSINNVKLYHIDSTLIGAESLYKQKSKGYLIDIDTRQIYDYEGEVFGGLRWHTLDGGVGEVAKAPETEEIWDGWIKLTLYYPSNSTERMWRLSNVGETRTDTNLAWQEYTGPIMVPLNRIQDIWIKYKINDKTVIVPPKGEAIVDIEPDTTAANVSSVKINIIYDEDATTKEYKVGDGGWQTYKGEFTVTEKCLIEAREVKPDNVYDVNGNVIQKRNIQGADSYYVGNIKEITDYTLAAPRIARLEATESGEVAKVRVTYPESATKKVYKENYGIEQEYTEDISIKEYGTNIQAYYYDVSGKKSYKASITINESISDPIYYDLIKPTIKNEGARNTSEITSLSVTYPAGATTKVYTMNNGAEISYTGVIPVTAYRTYVKAYYYGSDGRKSEYDWIYINDVGEEGPPPPTYITPPEPIINVTPTTIATSAQVTLQAPSGQNADRMYISINGGSYEIYKSPVTVTTNSEIRAYYITYEGKSSYTAYKRISNIRTADSNLPYVGITVNPYTSSKINKVTVTIASDKADKVEYSYNGIEYTTYTGPIEVSKNCTVYARGINSYGIGTDQVSITNIGSEPPKVDRLGVSITANPEPTATNTLVDKVKVTIEYDEKATKKYYKIGLSGELKEYTVPFEVTSNCTVYGYAVSDTGNGTDIKVIDNIVNGITEPLIESNPVNSIQSSKDKITITYDRNATVKQYRINGGDIRDYAGPFEITNNCTIYAYSQNAKGDKANKSYSVTNIIAKPPVVTIDYGKYYILKLSYPLESVTREYKWKANGEWKIYKEEGILLIKPEYKNEILDAGGKLIVKIKDENGVEKTFTGDYYVLDVGASEINENIFMRWDRSIPSAPSIILNTLEPTKEVIAIINYEEGQIKKQYKVVDKEGNVITNWTEYTGPIKITSNNTTIYAKGQDNAEVWSVEAKSKIINIDELSPEIKLTVDTTTAKQEVPIRVDATDDVQVGKVKWAKGIQADSYFSTNGTEISNNSIVKIKENGYYTFYVEDKAGNTNIYTVNIPNVDQAPPVLGITITPDTTVVTSVKIGIDYGDSVTKQYKIGESNTTWINYTGEITLSSYTVLTNNWKNSDGTVTVYVKGTDSVGNVKNDNKKIYSLDLDAPSKPVINSNAGYPVITSLGVKFDATTTITYDTRNDITNYYSVDSGATWKVYSGSFNYPSGTIIAKSVKKGTGLEVTTTKTVTMPSDALGELAYDGNDSTGFATTGIKYINVDTSMQGRKIRIKSYRSYDNNITISFLDENKTVISSIGSGDVIVTIPQNTKYIIAGSQAGTGIYEIQPADEPTFSATNGYMLLTADPTKGIKSPYQMVSIKYFSTSVQRLYRVGTTGEWLNYEDKAIFINQGETIYAKGIDQYGNETRTISSYTVNVTDAIGTAAYDGNDSTGFATTGVKYMNVDSSMQGKKIRIKSYRSYDYNITISFLDENKTAISSIGSGDVIVTIPQNTKYIIAGSHVGTGIYEIQIANEPTFSATNGYMLLHSDSTKAIKNPYQMVTIKYFSTSVQRLYRIGTTGEWLNYEDKAVFVNEGETIYAKGIDQYGNETRVVTNYYASVTDAIGKEAFDQNDTTYFAKVGANYMSVDSSMLGKKVRIKTKRSYDYNISISFLDKNKAVISSISGTVDTIVTVPINTQFIAANIGSGCKLYEIQPSI